MSKQVKSNRQYTKTEPLKSTEVNKIIPKEYIEPDFYPCYSCGKRYTRLKDNFPASQSELYSGVGYFLPICNNCLDNLFQHYTTAYGGDEDRAIRKICSMFDIYYEQTLLNSSRKISKNRSRIRTYISRANLTQYRGKTYDTTLDEENVEGVIETLEDVKESKKTKLKTVKFFGTGFTDEDYVFLEDEYTDWTTRHECNTKGDEIVFKQICYTQLDILKAKSKNESTKDLVKTLQELLDTGNLKPKQNKDTVLTDQNTFGTLIRKWEDEDPIPEPDEEWKDVDGIVKYITVYFLGHLCAMMGIKNSYSRMYNEEMDKYKVERPEYEDDQEALFDSIFSKGGNDDNDE